jgi:hypothetical protein
MNDRARMTPFRKLEENQASNTNAPDIEQEEQPSLQLLPFYAIEAFYESSHPGTEIIDVREVIEAIAKIVASMISHNKDSDRDDIIKHLVDEVLKFEAHYRQQHSQMGMSGLEIN